MWTRSGWYNPMTILTLKADHPGGGGAIVAWLWKTGFAVTRFEAARWHMPSHFLCARVCRIDDIYLPCCYRRRRGWRIGCD